jgi:hypothetical protein
MVAPAPGAFTYSWGDTYANIQCLCRALFHYWSHPRDTLLFHPQAPLFYLGGTANFLMFTRTDGERMNLSRWCFLKFIG